VSSRFDALDFIITTHRNILVVEGGEIREVDRLEVYECNFWGLTWGPEHIYVLMTNPGAARDCNVRVYSKPGFGLVRDIHLKHVKAGHQIFWWKGCLYMANTNRNCLSVYDLADGSMLHLAWLKTGFDYNHINSVWTDGSELYTVEHNGSKYARRRSLTGSRLRVLSMEGKSLWDVKIGKDVHNIYREGPLLYFCDSLGYRFCRYHINEKRVAGQTDVGTDWYVRGVARIPDGFLVGLSDYGKHKTPFEEWDTREGRVLLVDDSMNVVEEMVIPKCKQIFDVRVTNLPDPAHNGVAWE